MSPVDILQWTMGWSWPIVAGLGILMAWGLVRFMTWDEKEPSGEQSSGPIPGKHCVCQCE